MKAVAIRQQVNTIVELRLTEEIDGHQHSQS
jgi:hypothetical protein